MMIFHRVLPEPDPLFPGEPDADRFDAQLALLEHWFNILPLPDAIRGLREERLPPRPLTITFDDGYADNCTVALPILRHRIIPNHRAVGDGVSSTMIVERMLKEVSI